MNIPQLRFPEFKGEWKHNIWGNVLQGFYAGATPYRGKSSYYEGTNLWVSSGELNYNIITDTKEKISNKAVNETNLKKHPIGTLLIAITGLEAAGTRGRCALLGKEAYTNQSCMAFYDSEEISNGFLFLYYMLKGEQFAFKYCQGTKQQSYTAKLIKILPISYPTLPEQTKIVNFLSAVDKRIELLSNKVSQLEEYKKGVMQKLFSQEVRFKDENGEEFPEWEKKKLGQIYKFKQGVQVPINEQFSTKDNERERFIRIIDLTDSSVKPRYIEKYQYSDVIESNDLFMVRYGSPGLLGVGFKGVIANNLFRLIPKSNKCNSFFFYYILTYFNQRILNLTNTSTMPAINFTSLSVLKLNIPSLPEQTKIANFLSSIDNKIELATKELNQTEEYKKGLLQQLFI